GTTPANAIDNIITHLTPYMGRLYATVYGWGNWWTSAYEGPMVYSSADGVTWVPESTPGITDTKNYWIDSIEPYKGSLYISTTNFVTGTQVIKGRVE
ncbi:MAG: hypothetical protein Q8R48_03070, partial [Candidatus Omnitrophota bacterium]|nr:hypothetical protein [Candidatus Omnitrophota bacterium]